MISRQWKILIVAMAFLFICLSCTSASDPSGEDEDGDAPDGDAYMECCEEDFDCPLGQHCEENCMCVANMSITIHLLSDWPPFLFYSVDSGESFVDYPGLRMDAEGEGWWLARNVDRAQTGQLHFLFNDGQADREQSIWLRPKGFEDCLTCYFASSDSEVWIIDGLLYTSDPNTPIDGDEDGDQEDGDSSDGDVPDGDVPDGDVPDGDVPDGDVPDGDVPDGDVPDGDVPDGDVPDGDVPDGDVPDGDVPDGDVSDGDVPDGDAPDGDLSDGDVPTDGDLDPDPEPSQQVYKVHHRSGWAQPYVYYSTDEGTSWVQEPGLAMTVDAADWWVTELSITEGLALHFLFNDGGNPETDWHKPAGCGPDDLCSFETSQVEVWVKNGALLTANPDDIYTIYLDTLWSEAYLYYLMDDGQWSTFPGRAMADVASWMKVQVGHDKSESDLSFLFNNGVDQWHNPSGCSGEGCNFSTSDLDVWIRDGVLYADEPS